MTTDKTITIISLNDDWEGLYIDRHLVYQNHEIRVRDVLEALEIDGHAGSVEDENLGMLPDNLGDLIGEEAVRSMMIG